MGVWGAGAGRVAAWVAGGSGGSRRWPRGGSARFGRAGRGRVAGGSRCWSRGGPRRRRRQRQQAESAPHIPAAAAHPGTVDDRSALIILICLAPSLLSAQLGARGRERERERERERQGERQAARRPPWPGAADLNARMFRDSAQRAAYVTEAAAVVVAVVVAAAAAAPQGSAYPVCCLCSLPPSLSLFTPILHCPSLYAPLPLFAISP